CLDDVVGSRASCHGGWYDCDNDCRIYTNFSLDRYAVYSIIRTFTNTGGDRSRTNCCCRFCGYVFTSNSWYWHLNGNESFYYCFFISYTVDLFIRGGSFISVI